MLNKNSYYGWRIVLVGTLGMMFSVNTFKIFSFGIFVNPLHETFGWSRGDIFYTISIISFVTVFTSFLSGFLIDKIGARKLLFYSTLLVGLNIMGLYFLNSSIWLFYGLFVLMTIVGCGTLPGVYSKEVLLWFEKKKGLTLAIVSAGISIGAMLFPLFLTAIIEQYGWREAYLVIGILVCITAFILKYNLKHNPAYFNLKKDGIAIAEQEKYTINKPFVKKQERNFSQIIKSKDFWVLGIAFFFIGIGNTGIIVNLYPFLESKGYAISNVALIASVFGLALLVGRFVGGYFLDRINPSKLMVVFYALAALTLLPLIYVSNIWLSVFSTFIIGVALGATIPGLMFFISNLFGYKDFGKTQGIIFSVFQIGGIFGPLLIGLEENTYGTTSGTMLIFSIFYILASGLFIYLNKLTGRTIEQQKL